MVHERNTPGQRLRRYRRRRGWSGRQLAERANVSPSTVTRVESGEVTNPGTATLRKLAEAMGLVLDNLLVGTVSDRWRPFPLPTIDLGSVSFIPVLEGAVADAGVFSWADLDSEQMTVRIARAYQRVPLVARRPGQLGWELAQTKTRAGLRELPLPSFVWPHLRAQQARVTALRAACRAWWGEGVAVKDCAACDASPCAQHDLVFPNRRGTPLRDDHMLIRWKELLTAAGLPLVRMHDLRHTQATLMRRLGADMRTVQDQLGHANLRTTSAIYVDVVPELRRAASERFERALWPDEANPESSTSPR